MATYQEQIAQWRQQRAQQQIADRLGQIRQEHAQVARERDQAIAENDMETAELRDMDAQQLEQEWAHYNPPQQQADPRDVNFMQRRAAFFERHGQRGAAAYDAAHRYLVNRGWTPRTPNFYRAMDDLMEMHGQHYYGVRFDPNSDKTLTSNEAAEISGLSPKSYDEAYRQLKAQGRVK
jgi:hypothetical protein